MLKRASAALVTFASTVVLAQGPDFSGTWRLDETRSRIDAEANFTGLIAAGVPETLHLTQPANGTLVVESQINESHARLYVPGRESSTPVFLGESNRITMTSRWEGGRLVSEGSRESPSGTTSSVKEVFGLSADGRTLEIEIELSGDAERTSTLAYTRTNDVGTCDTWPSPCKERSPVDP